MSGPDRDSMPRHDHQPDVEVDASVRVGAERRGELSTKPSSSTALDKIDQILKGHGSMKDLPELFSVLEDKQCAAFRDRRLDELAKTPGDIALECARLLGSDAGQIVRGGLDGRPPVSMKQLRAFLIQQTGQKLATITGDTFTRLKAALGGALIEQIPSIGYGLRYLAEHAGFLRWLIETTVPGVCAHMISNAMSVPMAKTLDREHLWAWVDQLSPADVTAEIVSVLPLIQEMRARDRLILLAGPRASAGKGAHDTAHGDDLHQALVSKPTLRDLLGAIGRDTQVGEKDVEPLIAAMQRLHASADDVLAVASRAPIERGRGLRMLLAAPGVTPQHLLTLLGKSTVSVQLLADSRLRSDVRSRVRGLRVQDLLPANEADALHETIAGNAGLTSWFLDEASARDLLWFCTSSPAAAPRATRIVGQRFGFGWVRELTSLPEGKDAPLRVLALSCHDTAAERYIRRVLLGDPEHDHAEAAPIRGSRPADPDTRQGEGARLVEALDGTSEELLARLGDLDEGLRAKLGRSDETVRTIGARLLPEQWARAARYLDLTFRRVIAASPGRAPATVAYLHERPHAEELEALARPELVRRAAAEVHGNLLVVFRALGDAAQLAAALGRDPGLLELLLAGAEPNRVADLIAREPARAAAEPILEARPHLVEKLPRYKHMTAQGRAAIDRLAKAAPASGDARAALEDVRRGEVDTEARAKAQGARFHRIEAEHATLGEAIAALAGAHARALERLDGPAGNREERRQERRASEMSALALLEAHRQELPALLADPARAPIVDRLSALVELPPDAAIPWIGLAELVRLPNALRWWMRFYDPAALLHRVAEHPQACALVADALSRGAPAAVAWLGRMPRGAALDGAEQRALDQIRPRVRNPDALRALFEARFAVPAPAEYDAKAMDALYAIVARLPPGHVQQQRITRIVQQDLGQIGAGMYGNGEGTVIIDDNVRPGASQDTYYPEAMQGWHTAAEMQQIFGGGAAALEAQVRAGRVQAEVAAGATRYRMVEQKLDLFTQVVLHEIGHSVDELLGQRTPPVYDFAGWREYGEATFDAWAAEMGGWERVAPADRAKIREAWLDAARGKTTVDELVGPDHPALASRYAGAGVGIVKSAIDGKSMHYTERVQHGDRVFVVGSYPGTFYSVRAQAAEAAPSVYALYAPAEYFAESYVEYYRGVDGAPGSARQKGGALPAPVRQWFDDNVDRIRFDPRRVKGAPDQGG
jgi:hypothetical protein